MRIDIVNRPGDYRHLMTYPQRSHTHAEFSFQNLFLTWLVPLHSTYTTSASPPPTRNPLSMRSLPSYAITRLPTAPRTSQLRRAQAIRARFSTKRWNQVYLVVYRTWVRALLSGYSNPRNPPSTYSRESATQRVETSINSVYHNMYNHRDRSRDSQATRHL